MVVSTCLAVAAQVTAGAPQPIDLAAQLAGGKLKAVNREVTKLQSPAGVHVTEKEGPGVVWIAGSDFVEGTIEVNVRGRDVLQRSFLGVAFHGKDDTTYEAVYLRPFNFRATDPARHQHAVQYMASRITTGRGCGRSFPRSSRTRWTRPCRPPTGFRCEWS